MIYRSPTPTSALDNRELPVSLVDIKEQLRIEHSDQDRLLLTKIQAATAEVEQVLNAPIIAREFVLKLSGWPTVANDETDKIIIPNPPLISVTDIKYQDEDDAEQTLDAANYRVSNSPPQPYIALSAAGAWPEVYVAGDAISVTYLAGWATQPSGVPYQLREAIILRASTRMEMSVEYGLGSGGWALSQDLSVMNILQPFLRPTV
jgi:uncharacterized phiE125 gp8 family phage protein